MGANAGGFLATPPGLDGSSGLGLAALTGVPRPRDWPAVVAADAPELTGDDVHFVALADGTLVVDEDVPDGSLEPLAAAIEESLTVPYRAYGVRRSASVWAVAAEEVATTALAGVEDEPAVVEIAFVNGERTCMVDGHAEWRRFPELESIGEREGPDYAVRAERIEPQTWVVDAWPL